MWFGILAVFLMASVIGAGIYLLLPQPEKRRVEVVNKYIAKIKKTLNKKPIKVKSNNLLYGTSKYLDRQSYEAIRLLLLVMFSVIGIFTFRSGYILFGIFIYLFMYPQERIGATKTPFGFIKGVIVKSDKEKKDTELFGCLSLLKNMIVQKDDQISADFIIENLAQSMSITKPAFLQMLARFRMNKVKEAEEAFYAEIGTDLSKEIASLLMQMDQLDPAEFEEIVISKQAFVREYKKTRESRKAEAISDLIYIPIVVDAIIVLMNFLIIAYFIPQQDLILNFF